MIVTDILFKAKCKDKDMWVEGFYFNMPDKTRHYEESWRSYPFEKERIREHELDFDTFLHT